MSRVCPRSTSRSTRHEVARSTVPACSLHTGSDLVAAVPSSSLPFTSRFWLAKRKSWSASAAPSMDSYTRCWARGSRRHQVNFPANSPDMRQRPAWPASSYARATTGCSEEAVYPRRAAHRSEALARASSRARSSGSTSERAWVLASGPMPPSPARDRRCRDAGLAATSFTGDASPGRHSWAAPGC